jgi:hypothetical protein
VRFLELKKKFYAPPNLKRKADEQIASNEESKDLKDARAAPADLDDTDDKWLDDNQILTLLNISSTLYWTANQPHGINGPTFSLAEFSACPLTKILIERRGKETTNYICRKMRKLDHMENEIEEDIELDLF